MRGIAIRTTLGLAAALCVAGCASTSARTPQPVPGERDVTNLQAPGAPTGTYPWLYPTPQIAEYGERLLPLEGALVVGQDSPDFEERLRAYRLIEMGWRQLPFEGYALVVTSEAGRTVVLKGARDDAGRGWADTALAQVTVDLPSGRYARECLVLDWPAFPLRGNKRPQAWERGYRANFAWGAGEGPEHAGRIQLVYVAPGNPLDASMNGVQQVLDRFGPWQRKGVRHFALKFDDEGFALTPESEILNGSYPTALAWFVERVREGLERADDQTVLYLLPQTYWWNDPRFGPFARAIRLSGGLNSKVGLVLTGPEVVSANIDAGGLARARHAFGLSSTRALIYDNLGREGDWGPLTGRAAELRYEADGVFGERGTPVHRLTRLDWSWNPRGYDPETSWRRALFELAGPAAYDALRAACEAFRKGAGREDADTAIDRFAATDMEGWPGPVDQEDLVALLRADLVWLDDTIARTDADADPERAEP